MTDLNINSDNVVIIDVLRACTTLTVALKSGATKIAPMEDPEQARATYYDQGPIKAALGGSINGELINGFELGNSPLDYTPAVLRHKTLIYCSDNLSRAIDAVRSQERVCLGCFNNMNAVLAAIRNCHIISFLCVGKNGRFALEDAVCAGMFIQFILNNIETNFSLNDAASTARYLYYRHHRDILGMLNQSSHGLYLSKLGYSTDLEYAAQVNNINIIPELSSDKSSIIPSVSFEGVLNVM
jgi:2-phosphosulfolactate phosphatase